MRLFTEFWEQTLGTELRHGYMSTTKSFSLRRTPVEKFLFAEREHGTPATVSNYFTFRPNPRLRQKFDKFQPLKTFFSEIEHVESQSQRSTKAKNTYRTLFYFTRNHGLRLYPLK